jgi:hypothetical protein
MRPLPLLATIVIAGWLAAPAAAQSGKIQGIVRDINGLPIQGATVSAVHPEAGAHSSTSTTDSNGRFAIFGMRVSPGWHFIAEATGFLSAEGIARVRSQLLAPIVFTLKRDLSPPPGALTTAVRQNITGANALRDAGQYDRAIAAYEAILGRNAKLTMVNLVLASVYREKAKGESDTAARQALLEKAVAAYQALLKDDADNERAQLYLAGATADLNALTK